ncbi:MAG: leucine-rich repeat domain-containing protein [Oscillospiraceae bacterium]|nr:leucine-rich repeat domain-containing protein [Oscillospiraceae bacterium]
MKSKKLIASLLASLILAGSSATVATTIMPEVTNSVAYAETVEMPVSSKTTSDGFQYTPLLNEVTITGYSGTKTAVSIPSKIGGKKVTRIETGAFGNSTTLKSVSIPSTVKTISMYAFAGCKNLSKVTLCEGITTIDSYAFRGCSSLKTITIPASVTKIGQEDFDRETMQRYWAHGNPFTECKKLEKINVSSKNKKYTSVGGVLFDKKKTCLVAYPNAKGSTYTIPSTTKTIGQYAFNGCSSLKSVKIPSSVKKIEAGAFGRCDAMKSITVPKTVTSIGVGALGYTAPKTGKGDVLKKGFTVYGDKGSAAQKYVTDIDNRVPAQYKGYIKFKAVR